MASYLVSHEPLYDQLKVHVAFNRNVHGATLASGDHVLRKEVGHKGPSKLADEVRCICG